MYKTYIDEQFLNYAVIGAAVLGTGGGGSPKIGYLMAKEAIEKHGPVELIKVSDLNDGEIAAAISMMGAPSVSSEKIPNGNEFFHVIQTMEAYKKVKLDAIYPIEAGGLNSMIPIVAAATLGLPLIDVDCMGRAFPEVQMITQSIFEIANTPIAMCHEKLDVILVNAKEPKDMENYCRAITMSFGGSALMCESCVDKDTLSIFGIQDIITKSYDIGKIIKESEDPIEELISNNNAYHLFDGKIKDVYRRYDGGFNKGHILIDSFDNKENYEIYLQNENLVAFKNKTPICMVPDLICILDYQSKMPITTENIKFGQRISVIAFPCDEKWRTVKGLDLVGPKVFGYDFEYQPLEELEGTK